MSPALGSRKRFLYRVLIYGAAPLLGCFVFLDNPDDVRGRVIGGLAMLAGAAAIVLLMTRLCDPWGSIRYAFRPVSTLRDVVAKWDGRATDGDVVGSLHAHLTQQLPDLAITRGNPADDGVLTVGEEVAVLPATSPKTAEERDELVARLEALQSPLENRALMLVLPATDGDDREGVDVSLLNEARGVHVVRV